MNKFEQLKKIVSLMFDGVSVYRSAIFISDADFYVQIFVAGTKVEIDRIEPLLVWKSDYDTNYPILRNQEISDEREIHRYPHGDKIYESHRIILDLDDPHLLRKALKFITNI